MAAGVWFQVLGSLEQTVMEYLWEHGSSNITALNVQANRYNSNVSGTLQQLTKKGLLIREKSERNCEGYLYTPRYTKEELMIAAIEMILWDLKANPTERQQVVEAIQSQ